MKKKGREREIKAGCVDSELAVLVGRVLVVELLFWPRWSLPRYDGMIRMISNRLLLWLLLLLSLLLVLLLLLSTKNDNLDSGGNLYFSPRFFSCFSCLFYSQAFLSAGIITAEGLCSQTTSPPLSITPPNRYHQSQPRAQSQSQSPPISHIPGWRFIKLSLQPQRSTPKYQYPRVESKSKTAPNPNISKYCMYLTPQPPRTLTYPYIPLPAPSERKLSSALFNCPFLSSRLTRSFIHMTEPSCNATVSTTSTTTTTTRSVAPVTFFILKEIKC